MTLLVPLCLVISECLQRMGKQNEYHLCSKPISLWESLFQRDVNDPRPYYERRTLKYVNVCSYFVGRIVLFLAEALCDGQRINSVGGARRAAAPVSEYPMRIGMFDIRIHSGLKRIDLVGYV